jgi:hypothetical protein
MRKIPERGRARALLVIAELGKAFWLQMTFIIISSDFTTFDKKLLTLF